MRGKKGLVLCVDDEPNILRSLHWLLHKDFDVMTALNGASGLEMLRKHDFDVVVSDQRMPGMIGSEFLREACRTSPRAMRILLTGYSDMQAILRSINEGEIFRFVSKPWMNDELAKTVEEAATIARFQLAPPDPTDAQAGPASILLIDDSENMVRMLKDIIEPGTVLRHAGNLAEAVHILNTQPVGVIVSDTCVNGMDVTPMIKLLKQQRPEIASIVLTVDSDVNTIIQLINQGQIYRFVPKPVKPGFLKIMLASAIHKHQELKANPENIKRHTVDRLADGSEEKLLDYLQHQAQTIAPAAASANKNAPQESLLGRLSSGLRRIFD